MLAGTRPGGRPSFFASPKKEGKERRPRCAAPFGGARKNAGESGKRGNSPAAQTVRASLSAFPCMFSAAHRGTAQPIPTLALHFAACKLLGFARRDAGVAKPRAHPLKGGGWKWRVSLLGSFFAARGRFHRLNRMLPLAPALPRAAHVITHCLPQERLACRFPQC